VNALVFPKNVILLSIIWGGTVLGIAFRIFWLAAPRWLYVALYILLGWAAVLYVGDLVAAIVATMVLVLIGGLSYTVGALFYAFKRPNLKRGVFGFHELFHACTVLAFLCHWTAILLLVLHPVTGV
jgi:hemolysin III